MWQFRRLCAEQIQKRQEWNLGCKMVRNEQEASPSSLSLSAEGKCVCISVCVY
jgi:hypothetical protein